MFFDRTFESLENFMEKSGDLTPNQITHSLCVHVCVETRDAKCLKQIKVTKEAGKEKGGMLWLCV